MLKFNDELKRAEEDIFSGSLADAKEALRELEKVMETLTQTQAFKEANRLVELLEKGDIGEW